MKPMPEEHTERSRAYTRVVTGRIAFMFRCMPYRSSDKWRSVTEAGLKVAYEMLGSPNGKWLICRHDAPVCMTCRGRYASRATAVAVAKTVLIFRDYLIAKYRKKQTTLTLPGGRDVEMVGLEAFIPAKENALKIPKENKCLGNIKT